MQHPFPGMDPWLEHPHGWGGAVIAAAALYFLLRGHMGVASGIMGVFLIFACLGVGQSVQVRLDTGDQRLCVCGIPVAIHRPMESKARKALPSLHDSQIPHHWTWCATQVGSNNADAMVYRYYYCAASWVEVDLEIAKLVVRDIANYVQTTHATRGLPNCTDMIWPDVVDAMKANLK